jgi:hypothetical protein
MFVLGALALSAAADVAFFSPPPHRSTRPARRSEGDRGVIRNLIRSIRRALAEATEEPSDGWLPQFRDYPY